MTFHDFVKNPKIRCYAWIPTLLAYAFLVVYITVHHEPWRDEADTWLMVRDTNLLSLWHLMGYVGTPGLWYWLVMPFAKLGLGIQWQLYLNNAIAIAAAALVLTRMPLHWFLRLGIVFSYFVGFEYAVISRSYGLGMLLLFSAAALFSHRFKRPWTYGLVLALLANTNAHSLLLACSFLAISLWDGFVWPAQRAKSLKILAMGSLGVALAVLQMWPPAEGQMHAMPSASVYKSFLVFLAVVHAAVVPVYWMSASWFGTLAVVANVAAWISCMAMVVRKSFRASCFLIISSLALWGLYFFVHYGGMRHAGIFYLAMIAALWIRQGESDLSKDLEKSSGHPSPPRPQPRLYLAEWTLALVLIFSTGATFYSYHQEATMLFSGAKQAGNFITKQKLGDYVIAGFPDTASKSILPYIPQKQIWYAGSEDFGSYTKWDLKFFKNKRTSIATAFDRINQKFAATPRLLLLFNKQIMQPESLGYSLIYQTTGPIFRARAERYYLYARTKVWKNHIAQKPEHP